MNKVYNVDCMEYMKTVPDKYFELAIVDPPYGINVCNKNAGDGKTTVGGGSVFGGKGQKREFIPPTEFIAFDDTKPPSQKYFDELFRVSQNQIIWGGNNFIENLRNTTCMIVWDKLNSGDFADCELAWTSFNTAVRKFTFRWNGMLQGDMKNKEARIHPTQKPVRLLKLF